jgi:succinate-semialdehyde dehydrogenase/glutarate-semialdehyde dehydrogenase
MLARKLSAAVAAGCTTVAKPAADTPLSALAMARICEMAGLPAGVFNVVTTSGGNASSSFGDVIASSPDVRKVRQQKKRQ